MRPRHVVVVGGGVIGVASAYYLASRGVQVTLFEQDDLCSGSSEGNAGQVTPGHLPLNQPGTLWRNVHMLLRPSSPLYIPLRYDPGLCAWLYRFQRACNRSHVEKATEVLCALGRASWSLFGELAGQVDFGYETPGRLELCRGETSFEAVKGEASLLARFGFASEALSARQAVARQPAIQGPIAGAVFFPESGFCDPQKFVLSLARAATDLGVRIAPHTPVTDIQLADGAAVGVMTGSERVEADAVVLACGSWGPRLARRLGVQLPIQPGKGYHLDLHLPEGRPTSPIVLVEQRIFVTPLGDDLRLAGTMELSGFNLRQRPARIDALSAGADHYFAGIESAPIRSRWCHLRPMAPDGLPVIGPLHGTDRVWIATGHGMLGLTQGPITGQLVAEGVTGDRTQLDISPLSPSRF